jgi:hypothetical protein
MFASRLGVCLIVYVTLSSSGCRENREASANTPFEQMLKNRKKVSNATSVNSDLKESQMDIVSKLIEAQKAGVRADFVVRIKSYDKKSGRSPRPGSGLRPSQRYRTILEIVEPIEMSGKTFQVIHMTPPPEDDVFRNIGGIYRVAFEQRFVDSYSTDPLSSIGAGVLKILDKISK